MSALAEAKAAQIRELADLLGTHPQLTHDTSRHAAGREALAAATDATLALVGAGTLDRIARYGTPMDQGAMAGNRALVRGYPDVCVTLYHAPDPWARVALARSLSETLRDAASSAPPVPPLFSDLLMAMLAADANPDVQIAVLKHGPCTHPAVLECITALARAANEAESMEPFVAPLRVLLRDNPTFWETPEAVERVLSATGEFRECVATTLAPTPQTQHSMLAADQFRQAVAILAGHPTVAVPLAVLQNEALAPYLEWRDSYPVRIRLYGHPNATVRGAAARHAMTAALEPETRYEVARRIAGQGEVAPTDDRLWREIAASPLVGAAEVRAALWARQEPGALSALAANTVWLEEAEPVHEAERQTRVRVPDAVLLMLWQLAAESRPAVQQALATNPMLPAFPEVAYQLLSQSVPEAASALLRATPALVDRPGAPPMAPLPRVPGTAFPSLETVRAGIAPSRVMAAMAAAIAPPSREATGSAAPRRAIGASTLSGVSATPVATAGTSTVVPA